MPNWCEGNIRFRGTKEAIKRFLTTEIVSCRHENGEVIEERPIIDDHDDWCLIIRKAQDHSWLYIKNTRRNFLQDDTPLEIWMEEDDPTKEIIVCVDGFKAAWSFADHNAWVEFARKYNFDVKLTGYEKGMYFSQVKTVYRDGTVKETIHEYSDNDDWMWNCPQPNWGG